MYLHAMGGVTNDLHKNYNLLMPYTSYWRDSLEPSTINDEGRHQNHHLETYMNDAIIIKRHDDDC